MMDFVLLAAAMRETFSRKEFHISLRDTHVLHLQLPTGMFSNRKIHPAEIGLTNLGASPGRWFSLLP